jgi:phosphomannomutase
MKFGTSGLRGLSEELKGRPSALYATAFGSYLLASRLANPGDTILIGRDFRDSSPEIAADCVAALGELGFTVADCGTLPTPALALFGLQENAACLMVTGSHIPADRNGIKFYRPDGEIDKDDEAAITTAAAALDSSGFVLTPDRRKAEDRSAQCLALFSDRNSKLLDEGALVGMRVGVYQHSTVARDMLVELLTGFGADVIAFARSESFIPVDTEAVSQETISLLSEAAKTYGLDAIVSADGDGDRPLVADETGLPLRGDLLGLIAADFLGAKLVVTPVTSNSGIETAGNFDVTRTRVGSPFVIAAMQEALAAGRDGVAGFEANGGVLTSSTFQVNGRSLRALPTRDCFVPILATLSLAASRGGKLSAVASAYRLPFAAAGRLEDFPVETSARLMAHLRAHPDNLSDFLRPLGKVGSASDIDGLRVTLTDRRIVHVRPSGNAPEMRCYVEARTETEAAGLLAAGLDRIRQWADQN